jgi:hypothetical protein
MGYIRDPKGLDFVVQPFSKVGIHRRIKVGDLLTYQKKMKGTRKKQLRFLAQQAQELNLEYRNE